jgi:hypothetical protein
MDSIYMVVAALVGVIIGAGAAWFLLTSVLNKKRESRRKCPRKLTASKFFHVFVNKFVYIST